MDFASNVAAGPLGKHKPEKRTQTRRHAPYARPAGYSPRRPKSLAERVFGMYRHLAKPLLSSSPLGSYSEDAFAVPWRTVDRETAELREIFEAQERVAEAEKNRIVQEAKAAEETRLAEEMRLVEEARLAEEARLVQEAEAARQAEEARIAEEVRISEEASLAEEARIVEATRIAEEARAATEADIKAAKALEDSISVSEPQAESASDSVVTHGTDGEPDVAPVISDDKPQYESIFQTARRLAEERASGISIPTKLKPNPYIASGISAKPNYISKDKGKEPAVGRVSDVIQAVEEVSAAAAAAADTGAANVAEQEEDSEDGSDFEPNQSEDDNEEDILQQEMEPIDGHEEVTTSTEDVGLPEEPDEHTESQNGDEIEASNDSESVQVSIIDEPVSDESDAVFPVEVDEPQDSSEETEPPAVLDGSDEVDVVVSDSDKEDDGFESDQMTEEIASMASDNEADVQGISEDNVDAIPVSTPMRNWWPFGGGRSLFSTPHTKSAQKTQPSHQNQQEQEQLRKHQAEHSSDEDTENRPVSSRRRLSETPKTLKNTVAVGVQTPQSFIRPQKFVPLSFVDIAESGNRLNRAYSSHETASDIRSSVDLEPSSQPIERPADTEKMHVSKPQISAASLGIESRRSAKFAAAARRASKKAGVYYGVGYGSNSSPYSFNMSQSAPAGPMFTTQPASTSSSLTEVQKKSSITAQKILSIISDVAPPARSHATADAQDIINPYELSSPHPTRMRPKPIQQRRVLVPLSARLAKTSSAEGVASPAKSRVEADAASARALVESIESAAPPEIKARLGSAAPKPSAIESASVSASTAVAGNTPQKQATSTKAGVEKTASKSAVEETKAPSFKIASLFGMAPEAPTPAKKQSVVPPVVPAPVSTLASTPTVKPAPVPVSDPAVFTAPAAVTTTARIETPSKPPVVVAESTSPANSARANALALSRMQLPSFDFSLPESTPSSQSTLTVQKQVSELDSSLLPVFVFSIATDSAANSSGTCGFNPQTLAPGEWLCSMCELKNASELNECVACQASKSKAGEKTVETTATETSGSAPNLWAQSGFQMSTLKDGEWTCDMCMLPNPAKATVCVVCETPKPAAEAPATTTKAPAPAAAAAPAPAAETSGLAPNLWAQSGFQMPSLKDGEWTCDMCMLPNPKSATVCVVCEAAKPVNEASAPAAAPAPVAKPAPAAETAPQANLWASSGFQMPTLKDGEWKCGVCDITNPKTAAQCLACESPKPVTTSAAATEPAQPVPNLWAQSGFTVPALKDGEWTCDTCMLKNTAAATEKCAVCDAPKPETKAGIEETKKKVSELDASQLPSFGFELDVSKKSGMPVAVQNTWEQSGFKMPGNVGDWTCDMCMIPNPATQTICLACENPK